MSFFTKTAQLVSGAAVAATLFTATAQAETVLRGASMFDEEHAFTKTLRKFEELVGEKYEGDVTFDLRLNGELGVESDYVTFLNQGVAIDYTILAPSNMAKFAPSIPLMDMPFLFRDQAQWEAVLSSDVLKPLEDELLEKADIMVIGYAPISTNASGRTIIADKPPLPPVEKQALYDALQPDAQLLPDPPPTFIVYAGNDPVVPVDNAHRLAGAWRDAGGRAELHVFADAPHGFALDTPDLPVSLWPRLCEAWLRQQGFL